MKKLTLIIVVIFFMISSIQSQDIIYKKDGNKINVYNMEILENLTKYVKDADSSGSTMIMNNDEISFISFGNGDLRFFEKESRAIQRYNYKKNLINYHLFDLIVNNFKISYERILLNGKIGIQIPFAIGYGGNISGFDNVDNKFYTGLALNFYPTGQGKVRYFMGPAVNVGTGNYEDYNGYYNSLEPYDETYDTFILRFYVNNGVMFSPIPELSLSAVGSIGIRYVENNSSTIESVKTVGAFSFNLSYRF